MQILLKIRSSIDQGGNAFRRSLGLFYGGLDSREVMVLVYEGHRCYEESTDCIPLEAFKVYLYDREYHAEYRLLDLYKQS